MIKQDNVIEVMGYLLCGHPDDFVDTSEVMEELGIGRAQLLVILQTMHALGMVDAQRGTGIVNVHNKWRASAFHREVMKWVCNREQYPLRSPRPESQN